MFFSDSMQRKQSTAVSPNPPDAALLSSWRTNIKTNYVRNPCNRFDAIPLLKTLWLTQRGRQLCECQRLMQRWRRRWMLFGLFCSCGFQDTYLQFQFCPLAFICQQLQSVHTLFYSSWFLSAEVRFGPEPKRRKKRKCVPSPHSFQTLLLILLRYLLAGLGLFFLGLVIGWFTHNPPAMKPPAPPSDSSDLLEELLKGITADKIDALQK